MYGHPGAVRGAQCQNALLPFPLMTLEQRAKRSWFIYTQRLLEVFAGIEKNL